GKSRTGRRGGRRSSMRPRWRAARRPKRSRSWAATGTRRSSRSSATTATRRSPRSTRGRARSSASSSRGRSWASSSASSRRASAATFVEHVPRLFLVALAVGETDRASAVPLVEPAGLLVLLKDPEREAGRTTADGMGVQRAADPTPGGPRLDVQVVEHRAAERGEAEDPGLVPDPDLLLRDDAAEMSSVLLERVQG